MSFSVIYTGSLPLICLVLLIRTITCTSNFLAPTSSESHIRKTISTASAVYDSVCDRISLNYIAFVLFNLQTLSCPLYGQLFVLSVADTPSFSRLS